MRLLSTKILYRFHAYGGLWLGAHFLLFALTGFVLLFKPGASTNPEEAVAAPTPAAFAARFKESHARFPGERPLSLFPDEENKNTLHLRFGKDGSEKFRGARKVDLSLATGAELSTATQATGFFPFVLGLHRELLLGSVGKILVGISGFVLLLIALSGFFIYAPFRRGQAFDSLRVGSKPLFLADLHKWMGAAIGGWILLVTFTGIFLAFNSVLLKLYQARTLHSLNETYRASSAEPRYDNVQAVIEAALSARPGSSLDFLAFPRTEFSLAAHYLVLLKRPGPFGGEVHELAVVEAANARVAEVRELPLYLKTLLLSEPLHFGDYGGLPLKILWGAFAATSFVMAIAGIWGWFAKRAERRRPLTSKRARRLPIVKARYPANAAPLAFAILSLAGAGLALIASGIGDLFAYALFSGPLLALLFTGARRWRERKAPHA